MTAKLRSPWSTKLIRKPAPSATVFVVEKHADGWHPIVERHENCLGMNHDGCVIKQRFLGPGMRTREQAEHVLAQVQVKHGPEAA